MKRKTGETQAELYVHHNQQHSAERGLFHEAIDGIESLQSDVQATTPQMESRTLPMLPLKHMESPWPLVYAVTYILIIAMAEVVTAYFDPKLGLILHSSILFAMFAHAAFLYPSDKPMSSFLMSVGFAPLIRIVSLSAPLSPFSYIQWFLILSLPLFAGILVLRYVQGLRESDLGLILNTRMLHWELAIGLTGFIFGITEYFILRPGPLIEEISIRTLITPVMIMMICTGLIEELIFRGLVQHNATRVFGPWLGMFFSASLFAFLHIGNLSVISVGFVFLVGFVYSLIVRHTGSIVGVSISHGLANTMLFLIAPLYF